MVHLSPFLDPAFSDLWSG